MRIYSNLLYNNKYFLLFIFRIFFYPINKKVMFRNTNGYLITPVKKGYLITTLKSKSFLREYILIYYITMNSYLLLILFSFIIFLSHK